MSATPIDVATDGDGVTALTPPGSLVRVRDETWLVTSVEETSDGALFTVRGVSDFVEGIEAQFYESLDRIIPVNPHEARLVGGCVDALSKYSLVAGVDASQNAGAGRASGAHGGAADARG